MQGASAAAVVRYIRPTVFRPAPSDGRSRTVFSQGRAGQGASAEAVQGINPKVSAKRQAGRGVRREAVHPYGERPAHNEAMRRRRAENKKKSPPGGLPRGGRESSGDLLSRARRPGTIGDRRLNCRVRNGNGCDPPSITAETILATLTSHKQSGRS